LSATKEKDVARFATVGIVPDQADRGARIAMALPPLDARARERAADRGWELRLLDPENADERSMLIRLAHPELDDAIAQGRDEFTVGGQTMNARLHLSIHEVVATQIIEGEPPEAFATAKRLIERGRDHHQVLHMLGSAIAEQIWHVTHEQRPYSREEHLRALAALPDSWDEHSPAAPPVRPRRAGSRRAPRRRP
jgi:hypothetical protein